MRNIEWGDCEDGMNRPVNFTTHLSLMQLQILIEPIDSSEGQSAVRQTECGLGSRMGWIRLDQILLDIS